MFKQLFEKGLIYHGEGAGGREKGLQPTKNECYSKFQIFDCVFLISRYQFSSQLILATVVC